MCVNWKCVALCARLEWIVCVNWKCVCVCARNCVCVCVCVCHSLSVAVIFASTLLHLHVQPFMDDLITDDAGAGKADRPVTPLVAHAIKGGANTDMYMFEYNRLESVYLVASMTILLSGMVFQSDIMRPSSSSYTFLTVLVMQLVGVCVHGGGNTA